MPPPSRRLRDADRKASITRAGLGDVALGDRAVMFYLAQLNDCDRFRLAADIDPGYAAAFAEARATGVEAICYACDVSPDGIEIARPLPLVT